jgi:signal transduction histidine kinase
MESLRVIFINANSDIGSGTSSGPSSGTSSGTSLGVEQRNQGLLTLIEEIVEQLDVELVVAPKLATAVDIIAQTQVTQSQLTQPQLTQAQAIAQTKTDVILCPLWDGQIPSEPLSTLQRLVGLATVVLIKGQPELKGEAEPDDSGFERQLQKLGIWDLLSVTDLRSQLGGVLRHIGQSDQTKQKAALANYQLQQTYQLVQQQEQLIETQAQQIQQLESRLAAVSQAQGQFLRTVSHELRTPMNAILGFSQFLRRRPDTLSSRQFELVERIFNNATRLLHLIDEILNFARLEAGQLSIQPSPIELDRLLWAVIDQLQPEASQKGLGFRVRVGKIKIVSDPTYLQQVLYNLLANAVKFTAAGYISVVVELVSAQSQAESDRIVISIRDTGIGMQPAEIQHIFKPFRQADQSLARQYQGLGLGLAVTALLVQQLQGTITVNSQVGQGSEFRIELPRSFKQVGKEVDRQAGEVEATSAEMATHWGRFQKV